MNNHTKTISFIASHITPYTKLLCIIFNKVDGYIKDYNGVIKVV